jgi:hypothetical protein
MSCKDCLADTISRNEDQWLPGLISIRILAMVLRVESSEGNDGHKSSSIRRQDPHKWQHGPLSDPRSRPRTSVNLTISSILPFFLSDIIQSTSSLSSLADSSRLFLEDYQGQKSCDIVCRDKIVMSPT